MKHLTVYYVLRGCAARIAANRKEQPVKPITALVKLFAQPRRDYKCPGAPRIGWKRGELFEVAEAVIAHDCKAAKEELGDCAYYLAQSPVWPVLYMFPKSILDNAVRKMTARAFNKK